MADEELNDEGAEGAQPAATEFVPEQSGKPKSNVYTALLVLTFCAFFAGCWLAGREAWEHYDVQFFVFTKQPPRKSEGGGGGGGTPVNASTDQSGTKEGQKDATPPSDTKGDKKDK